MARIRFTVLKKAKAAFAKAKEELQAKGVTFPIHLDIPVEQTDVIAVQQTNSLKQSIESSLGTENVIVDVLQMTDNEKLSITSQAKVPSQKRLWLERNWLGPDYQDPATYLNILDAKKGSALKHLGIKRGQDPEVMAQVGLDEYKKLLDDAAAETSDLNKRYEKYAKAQAWVSDSSLLIPVASSGGSPTVSRTVPFTKAYSQVGIKGARLCSKDWSCKWRCDCKRIRRSLQEMATRKNWDKCQIPKELEKHVKVIYKKKRKLQETVLPFFFETPVVIKAVTLHFWINLIKYGYVIKKWHKEWMMIKMKKKD